MKNITYSTEEIKKYFSENRISWDQFYESEKKVITKTWNSDIHEILDIGCGCGGLYSALKEKFGKFNYTGIEINQQAADFARQLYKEADFHHADFDNYHFDNKQQFDMVFSLSCIDWNVNFDSMFHKAWSLVKEGGFFLFSLRMDLKETIKDPKLSYQYINYSGEMKGELANYVVISANEISNIIKGINPAKIVSYGYYGSPGKTAVTPFKNICFSVFSLKKAYSKSGTWKIELDIQFPEDIKAVLEEEFK